MANLSWISSAKSAEWTEITWPCKHVDFHLQQITLCLSSARMSTVVNVETIHQPHGFTLDTLDLSVCFHGNVPLRDVLHCIVSFTVWWSQQLLMIYYSANWDFNTPCWWMDWILTHCTSQPQPQSHTVKDFEPHKFLPLVCSQIFAISDHVLFPPTSIWLWSHQCFQLVAINQYNSDLLESKY